MAKVSRKRGAVAVEAAVVIPLLLLIYTGLLRFSEQARLAFAASQVAREVALTGALLPLPPQGGQLPAGGTVHESQAALCTPGLVTSSGANCSLSILRWRVDKLVEAYGFKPADFSASVQLVNNATDDGRRIEVRLTGTTEVRFGFPKQITTEGYASSQILRG